jgi:formamidopyrimidine-DNA glycosylase
MGQAVMAVGRRGKYLLFYLSGSEVLILHLRMSGSLIFQPTSTPLTRHTRTVFILDDGTELRFVDPRKLGVMWLVEDEAEVVGKLGPEPLEADFTPGMLRQRLSGRKASIKALLCDQTFIAGIGNMYADEILFDARIHPLRKGNGLSQWELERLCHAVGDVLRSAIRGGGASISNYQRPDGSLGHAQFSFRVAHRRGEPCPACGTPIKRIVVRNRGTYFCPRCQKEW